MVGFPTEKAPPGALFFWRRRSTIHLVMQVPNTSQINNSASQRRSDASSLCRLMHMKKSSKGSEGAFRL